ncbi:conserved hypothetical protein [Stutzerimonas stutzeri A1501]|uniref:Uncharacterized protein n=1 Tax=Stutzerimonas stutzeri (strain A1501) TaxID=379731 RepID=A4VIC1_STUS1|nr:conserved hypothetical protein [Stutzerimonas stutzeri A1501]
MLGVADQPAQVLAVGFGEFDDEGFQRLVIAGDEPVAPALEGVEAFVVLAGRGVELIDQGDDGIDILITHQLADVLDVPFAGDMRLVLRGVGQGLVQRVAERQPGDEVGFERGQAFAEFLQGEQFALDLGFAFFVEIIDVGVFRHGDGPLGNAAMIAAALAAGSRLAAPGCN